MATTRALLLFVTGLSGSGKSLASNVLEDLGFYVLDNLPSPLIAKFVELLSGSWEEIARAALVVDLRDRHFTRDFPEVFRSVRSQGHDARILFLEASDDVLVRRFSETRRSHPLAADGTTTVEAIRLERQALDEIRSMAHQVVDTTELSIHGLAESVVAWLGGQSVHCPALTVNLLTFGFKHGLPRDADWVFDVRFLPNPFFVAGLREMSGRDQPVRDHVMASPAARPFVERVCDILRDVLPLYGREGRSHLTVAIGCTGGRHRSVAIAHQVAQHLVLRDTRIISIDRDIDKG